MTEAIRRNVTLGVGILACAVICAAAAPWAVYHTGAPGAGVLQAESPIAATLAAVVALAAAAVVAGLVGRFSNAAVGLFALGAGVFVLARRMGTVQQLLYGDGSLALIGVETLLWTALVLGCVMIVFAIAGPLADIEPEVSGRQPDPFFSREAVISAGAGVIMIAIVWIVAQSPMKGQVLGAPSLAGVGAGLAGRLISPHVQPILLFASPLLFAGLAHLMNVAMLQQPADITLVSGMLSTLNRPMPADYAAGSLTGVAFGLGWAKSFLHHEEPGQG